MSDIFGACIDGDHDALQRILANDPELIHARDGILRSTPLIFAAHRGHTACVESLLAAGADVFAREQASDTTVLHWVAEGGQVAEAERLLERGVELDPRDGWHDLPPLAWTSVVVCAPNRHADREGVATLLLERGAARNIFHSIATGDEPGVRSQVDADARVLERPLGWVSEGKLPLHYAVSRCDMAMVRLLLDLGADIDARTGRNISALALAIDSPRGDIVDLLVDRGVSTDASAAIAAGETAHIAELLCDADDASALLYYASLEGDAVAAASLLAVGADSLVAIPELWSEVRTEMLPLHRAAAQGHVQLVGQLLDAGGAVDHRTGGDWDLTPLHLAAGGGHLATVRLLVERGADLEASEKHYGGTPLGWAEHVSGGEPSPVVEYLQGLS
jgi:ankyrin repeat protein